MIRARTITVLGAVLAFVSSALGAQSSGPSADRCSVGARYFFWSGSGLDNNAGDAVELSQNDQLIVSVDFDDNVPYARFRSDYGFTQTPIVMRRTATGAFRLGIECRLWRKTSLEARFFHAGSQASVNGQVGPRPYVMPWVRLAWESQPFGLINTKSCTDVASGLRLTGVPCVSPTKYWARDDFSLSAASAVFKRELVNERGFQMNAEAGLALVRTSYIYDTGEELEAYFVTPATILIDGKSYLAEYGFQNNISLSLTNRGTRTFVGLPFGAEVKKSFGRRFSLSAQLRHTPGLLSKSGRSTFVDVDDFHDYARDPATGKYYVQEDGYLNGLVDVPEKGSGFASWTEGNFGGSMNVSRWLSLDAGLNFTQWSFDLSRTMVDLWGLGSNKAPRAMEFEPQQKGFGFKSGYAGVSVRF